MCPVGASCVRAVCGMCVEHRDHTKKGMRSSTVCSCTVLDRIPLLRLALSSSPSGDEIHQFSLFDEEVASLIRFLSLYLSLLLRYGHGYWWWLFPFPTPTNDERGQRIRRVYRRGGCTVLHIPVVQTVLNQLPQGLILILIGQHTGPFLLARAEDAIEPEDHTLDAFLKETILPHTIEEDVDVSLCPTLRFHPGQWLASNEIIGKDGHTIGQYLLFHPLVNCLAVVMILLVLWDEPFDHTEEEILTNEIGDRAECANTSCAAFEW